MLSSVNLQPLCYQVESKVSSQTFLVNSTNEKTLLFLSCQLTWIYIFEVKVVKILNWKAGADARTLK